MTKIYRLTDRITVKIGDVTVKLSPMSFHQKAEVQEAMLAGFKNTDIRAATRGLALAIQYTVKAIDGVEDSDDKPYKLQFNELGTELTSECVDELMNIELSKKLSLICAALINGVPAQFTDQDHKALDGVELIKTEKSDSKKKN